jgi:hypothetical protein
MESLNSKYQIFDIYDNVQKEIKKKYKWKANYRR